MAPLNEQQLEQIHDERREQIKKAALKVFARHGINGTKMSMIAAEAGISQGLSTATSTPKKSCLPNSCRRRWRRRSTR